MQVVAGAIFDVAIDIRDGSPAYGHHVSAVNGARNQNLLQACLTHGMRALVSNHFYEPDKGLLWNDPALGIDWPISVSGALLPTKDRNHPRRADLPAHFTHRG